MFWSKCNDFFHASNGFTFDCSGICGKSNTLDVRINENNYNHNNNFNNSIFGRVSGWVRNRIRLLERWIYAN